MHFTSDKNTKYKISRWILNCLLIVTFRGGSRIFLNRSGAGHEGVRNIQGGSEACYPGEILEFLCLINGVLNPKIKFVLFERTLKITE